MVGKTRSVNQDHLVRRCVGCGYDGALLMSGKASRCVSCGCDLAVRPARSYAEMEGLAELANGAEVAEFAEFSENHGSEEGSISVGPDRAKPWSRGAREPQLIQNWLAFLFFVLLGLLLLISLVAAAVP